MDWQINIVKITIPPKTIYNQSLHFILHENRKQTNNKTTHMEPQKTLDSQKNHDGRGRVSIPDLKIHYRGTVIKTVWCRHRNRHVDQGNKTEDPNLCTLSCSHLIFDKNAK